MDVITIKSGTIVKEITVPQFGNVNIVVQNGKIYKVEKTESNIIKTK